MSLAISVQHAKKHYFQDVPVLRGVDMEVKEGSIYGLLGPSGCGKTTLLKCIMGLFLMKLSIRTFLPLSLYKSVCTLRQALMLQ